MNLTLDALLKEYGHRLELAGIPKPYQEARQILQKIVGIENNIDPKCKEALEEALGLRENRMPLDRIFGTTAFCGLILRTKTAVFRPYAETENLVHFAIMDLAPKTQSLRILDLGTGTGCILLALLHALPQATGVGIDLDDYTLDLARENAKANKLSDRVEFKVGNWSEGISEKFDLVISNPPRIAIADIPCLIPEMRNHDPFHSLAGGEDGLDFCRKLAEDFARLANEDALCLCQIGPKYASEVAFIFRKEGFEEIKINKNFMGYPCCITVAKSPAALVEAPLGKRLWKRMLDWLN